MRSNELRIGNWVQCAIIKIGSLKKGGFHQVEIDDFNYNLEDYFRPIPLTEDWLVKFGFERNKKTFVDGAYGVTFSRNKDGGWAIYDTSIDEGTNYLTPNLGFCQHVHQLQNLYFALTGEELTIKE